MVLWPRLIANALSLSLSLSFYLVVCSSFDDGVMMNDEWVTMSTGHQVDLMGQKELNENNSVSLKVGFVRHMKLNFLKALCRQYLTQGQPLPSPAIITHTRSISRGGQ